MWEDAGACRVGGPRLAVLYYVHDYVADWAIPRVRFVFVVLSLVKELLSSKDGAVTYSVSRRVSCCCLKHNLPRALAWWSGDSASVPSSFILVHMTHFTQRNLA